LFFIVDLAVLALPVPPHSGDRQAAKHGSNGALHQSAQRNIAGRFAG
jgi:hypothetical protein